jgi:sterol desaturase/sphingolipid hydroxylase (fatty acid hydroxylase superfamily)
MISNEELYQILTFVSIVAILDLAERIRPHFPVNRRHNLALNIASLLIVIVVGELWKPLLIMLFNALRLPGLIAVGVFKNYPGPVKILLAVIMADFILYWVHRWMHRQHFLWLTHAFHHSIDELWWLSGSRTSVTHLFLFAAPQVLIGFYLFQLTGTEAGIAFSFGVVVNVWIHTNILVNLGPLQWLIITPNYHRLHHGTRGLAGKNLGFVFTLWDRMFGTFADPGIIEDRLALSAVSTKNRLLRMIAGV